MVGPILMMALSGLAAATLSFVEAIFSLQGFLSLLVGSCLSFQIFFPFQNLQGRQKNHRCSVHE
jgi:hypothetical protein